MNRDEMDNATKMELEQTVAFAILMENGEGILGKSPKYILEKFRGCFDYPKPEKLLDVNNLQKFNNWKIRWLPIEER